MKYISLPFCLVTLYACASSNSNLASDGMNEHTIYCSGGNSSWDVCYTKAEVICGKEGYDEIQKYEDEGAFAAYDSALELPNRRLVVQCKK